MTLDEYLLTTNQSTPAFARLVGVTRGTMFRYRTGAKLPRAQHMLKIIELTEGKVTADDILKVLKARPVTECGPATA